MSRYLLIIRECNISSYYSSAFEVTTYIIIDLLRLLFYFQFALDAGSRINKITDLFYEKKKCCFWFLTFIFIVTAVILSVGSGILSFERDKIFVNECHKATVDDKMQIIYAHTTFLSFAYWSTLMVCFYSVAIFYSSICTWKEEAEKMKLLRSQPEGTGGIQSPDGPISLSGVDFKDKLCCLYNDYIEVGEQKTSLERNSLRRWFVIMYLVYLVHVLIQLVHIMKIISIGLHNYYNLTSSIMNIFLHFVAFFFPYCMGISLNSAHHSYHKKMIDTYFGVEIILDDDTHYLCKQGNYIKKIIITKASNDENTSLLPKTEYQDVVDSSTKETVGNKYKEYFKKALGVQTSIIMTKKDEFDFVPSFLSISVPLESHGYTLAVLLTVISIIFNFVQAA